MAPGITVLSVEGLSKSFAGLAAVHDISLRLHAGGMLALIGPNGAGKTTLFNLIGGQIRPDTGRIRLLGRDITGAAPRALCRQGLDRTFQTTTGFGSMLIREAVQLALLAGAASPWGLWRLLARRHRADTDALLAKPASPTSPNKAPTPSPTAPANASTSRSP